MVSSLQTYFLGIVIFFMTNHAVAQDTIVKYLDQNLAITPNMENASFVAKVKKMEQGWYANIYYGNENLAMSGTFKDKNLTTKNGLFTFYYASTGRLMAHRNFINNYLFGTTEFWYENGKKKDSGKLFYGKKIGAWKFWHDNGTLAAEGRYVDSLLIPNALSRRIVSNFKSASIADFVESYYDDYKIKLWKTYYDNKQIKDSINYSEEGFKQGFKKSWYSNGQLESFGYFNDDKEESDWTWYHENGKMATKEVYKKGKVQTLECFDTTGKYVGDYCGLNKMAAYPGGEAALNKYIAKYIQYPEESLALKKDIRVKVKFVVDKEGLIGKTTFEATPNIYFNREVERLLFAMPKWDPAIKHNRIVVSEVTMEIDFIFSKATKPL
jgi:hypothetical protein